MSRLPWPDLFARLRPRLELKGNNPDGDGWWWARCIDTGNHRNGDRSFSLRVNERTGGVSCMSQGCISGNLNGLAERLDVSADQVDTSRTGTIRDLAEPRKLNADRLIDPWGVTCTPKGWSFPVDDEDAQGVRRLKRYPWATSEPKYKWARRGVKAADMVYNLSRLDPKAESVFVAAGEPDVWVFAEAELAAVSFLAGENAAPSAKAIAKLKARAPELKAIHLAYDRDDAGGRGAQRVGAALHGAGLNVEIIQLPDDLPEGGDITDLWVSCAGDREAFLRRLYGCETEWLKREAPRVQQHSDDRFSIMLPSEGGWTHWDFDRISRGQRSFDTELSVTVDLPGITDEPYTASINLLSVSGRDSLRRQLEQTHTDLPWAALINRAYGELRRAFFEVDPSVDLSTVEPRSLEERHRLGTLLPEGQPAVYYGDGGTAKTYLAIAGALSVATGDELLGLPVIYDRVLIVDYETDRETHRFRCDRLLAGFELKWQAGLIDYWAAKGRPFADIADAVRRKVERDRIGLIIVDSAGYACGGDPANPELALRYFNALNAIGKSSLTIAHVAKDSDQEKPYGSVFWHNAPRKTWNFQRVQDEGEDVIHVGLFNKKVNDGRKDKPLGFRMEFDGETGPVKVKREDLRDVPQLDKSRPLKLRILDALSHGHGPMSYEELGDALETPAETIRTRVNEMKDSLIRHGEGKAVRWSRKDSYHQ